jgi:hypothetical protein
MASHWRAAPVKAPAASQPASTEARPYFVKPADRDSAQVEAWAGYPLQFEGQRRYGWQDQMAAELRTALRGLNLGPGSSLAGTYVTTDHARCDVENRLFTNPGSSSFPKGITSIRFERGVGPLPNPPTPIATFAGHVHHYRYRPSTGFQTWEPTDILARWHRVPRTLPGDGSARPVWLAMRQAAAAGRVEVLRPPLPETEPFGIRILVHATAQGPRAAPVISETFVDGVIAAFQAPAPDPQLVAAALAPRLPGTSSAELNTLAGLDWRGVLFGTSPFTIKGSFVQISPCDEGCVAGEVSITPDASGRFVETSGELFMLRQAL